MATSDDDILLIVKEIAQQVAQQVKNEIGQQQAGQIGQQGLQGSTQEKASLVDAVTQNKQEETNTGEAHRGKTYVDAEMWGLNKKALVEKSIDFDRSKKANELIRDAIGLADAQANSATHRTQQHVQSMMSILNVYAQIQSVADQAKFNAAVSEPIAPNTGYDE